MLTGPRTLQPPTSTRFQTGLSQTRNYSLLPSGEAFQFLITLEKRGPCAPHGASSPSAVSRFLPPLPGVQAQAVCLGVFPTLLVPVFVQFPLTPGSVSQRRHLELSGRTFWGETEETTPWVGRVWG